MSEQSSFTSNKLDYWKEQLSLKKRSGLTVKDYCLQAGISEASFYHWQQKIFKPRKSSKMSSKVPPKFIKVNLRKPDQTSFMLELITPSGLQLKFNESVSPKYLSQLVAALQGVKAC